MDYYKLSLEILQGLSFIIRGSSVVIWSRTNDRGEGEVGSGFLIRNRSETFLVTCYHVVKDLYASTTIEGRCFRPDDLGSFDRSQLQLVAFNRTEDLALLKVVPNATVKEHGLIVTVDRFGIVRDYSLIRPEAATYIVNGYPSEFVELRQGRRYPIFQNHSYFTTLHSKQASEPRSLILDYPMGQPMDAHLPETKSNFTLPLFDAAGLSGSPVFAIPPIPSDPAALWNAGDARIVAIQVTRARDEPWIRCAPTYNLWDWLGQHTT